MSDQPPQIFGAEEKLPPKQQAKKGKTGSGSNSNSRSNGPSAASTPVALPQTTTPSAAPPPTARRARGRQGLPVPIRACLAKLKGKYLISADATAKAYKAVLKAKKISGTSLEADSVLRSTVEAGVIIEYDFARKLSIGRDRFLGIDESSKGDGRSFIEIEFGVKLPHGELQTIPVVREVVSHKAEDMLGM